MIALNVKDLGFVFSMLGTIASAMVILIVPASFYLQLFPEGPDWKRTGCKALFCLGIFIMIVSSIFNIMNASGTSLH